MCHACGSPFLVEHDLEQAVRYFEAAGRKPTDPIRCMLDLWPVLPLEYPSRSASLYEGGTPLYPLDSRQGGAGGLWVKDESRNPTGSFKARGMFVALNRLRELGIRRVVIPSAGNAAAAAAAYAAALGTECCVIVPEGTPPANVLECLRYGARVVQVKGSIHEAALLARKLRAMVGSFDLTTLREPYRLEGKKTMGYELFVQCQELFGRPAPDFVLYPTGGGTGLIGIWKAYQEMRQLNWFNGSPPRLVAVQAEGCAPIVRAFREGAVRARRWENPQTIASGLRVPGPAGDRLMLRAIRETEGTAISVSDPAILSARRELARQGHDVCPEAAACWAAYHELLRCGFLQRNDLVVLLNTATGLKYNHLDELPNLETLDPEDVDWDDLDRTILREH